MEKVLLILSPGFEEIEAIAPLDILRRAGIPVDSAAADGQPWVVGSHGIRIRADKDLRDCPMADYGTLLLPGGPGVEGMKANPLVLERVREAHGLGLRMAAICAAPALWAVTGVGAGRKVTSFPATRAEVEPVAGAYLEDRVVIDGPWVSARGAGCAEEFALALVALIAGRGKAEDVRLRMVARAG